MTHRSKLSLEPGQRVRPQPPKGFLSEGTAPRAETTGARTAEASAGPVEVPGKPSTTKGPIPATESNPAEPRPPPSPPDATIGQATAAAQESNRSRIDRATLVKILVGVGVAALTILLLKRRLY